MSGTSLVIRYWKPVLTSRFALNADHEQPFLQVMNNAIRSTGIVKKLPGRAANCDLVLCIRFGCCDLINPPISSVVLTSPAMPLGVLKAAVFKEQ